MPAGNTTSPDAWKKQLADATGAKYKPKEQQEDAWEDTTGLYDTHGNLLSFEDYADDDDGEALDDDDDDRDWADDFGDNEGLVEDQEIFNMDTGWAIEDFIADAPEPPALDHKV